MSGTYRRILVVDLLGGLGDLLMLLPSVHALARNHPGAEVHLLTHRPGDSLVEADEAVTAVLVPERRGGAVSARPSSGRWHGSTRTWWSAPPATTASPTSSSASAPGR
ncbi:hypothetical protein [Actinoalloteichus caeruleus]|uniref:hypothetical protein n=1 Tax=Actinoalloteichus cyanogriseus TaxID=2893586 RepID=UPI0020A44C97|nr:hypothetical protein [Actinoalloteichus caeruleus]